MAQHHPFVYGTQVSVTWSEVGINEMKAEVVSSAGDFYLLSVPECEFPFDLGPIKSDFVTELNP